MIVVVEDSPRCPGCGEEEDVIVICRKCYYEYEKSNTENRFKLILFIVSMVVLGTIGLTFMLWFSEATSKYNPYTGTYTEWMIEGFKTIVKTLKRIW